MSKTEHTERRHTVRIQKLDEARRLIYGEVYAPDRLDTHGEFMTAKDIETMAHRFMQLKMSEAIDTNHDNQPNGSFPVESFIAREGDPDYTEGAWVLGVKVPDDAIWNAIKAGHLNAYSFEARVVARDVEIEYYVMRDHVGAVEKAMDHDHAYFLQMSSDGRVLKGWTSPGPDGHVHDILKASLTEPADGHIHRYFL